VAQTRTIAIGDIHGCGMALEAILDTIDLMPEDTLVILGDAIDRGPVSRAVIEQLLVVGERCRLVPILGNHEQMLLDAIDGRVPLQDWLVHGGAETLDSYGKDAVLAALPDTHVDFVRSWGDYYETDDHFFAHANYLAEIPLANQPWEAMRWRSFSFFWPAPHRSGKIAIVGHTANKQGEIVDHGHLICIDTYCHGGRWLTALEPATGQMWQAGPAGQLRTR